MSCFMSTISETCLIGYANNSMTTTEIDLHTYNKYDLSFS